MRAHALILHCIRPKSTSAQTLHRLYESQPHNTIDPKLQVSLSLSLARLAAPIQPTQALKISMASLLGGGPQIPRPCGGCSSKKVKD